MSKKYPVTFDHIPTQPRVETCTFCGGKVEECPMLRGVCYDCYRKLIEAKQVYELDKGWEEKTQAVHNYVVAAEAGDRAALQFGDYDLGTRVTISGGEVMELESRYDEQNGGDDLPF